MTSQIVPLKPQTASAMTLDADKLLDQRVTPLEPPRELLPVATCHAVITSVDVLETQTMPAEQALGMAQKLAASFNREPKNADMYLRQITSVLSSYPAEIVNELVFSRNSIVLRQKWLPEVAEVEEHASRLMGRRRYRRYVAREMIKEHDRLDHEMRIENNRISDEQWQDVKQTMAETVDAVKVK